MFATGRVDALCLLSVAVEPVQVVRSLVHKGFEKGMSCRLLDAPFPHVYDSPLCADMSQAVSPSPLCLALLHALSVGCSMYRGH